MKKLGAFAVLFLVLLSISLVIATETISRSSSTSSQQDPDKIEDGFNCLEKKADDCSGLSTEEIALTILATPDNIFDDCVNELKTKRKSNHWGNIKDTALAILALKHADEDTKPSEKWLIAQNRTPTELTWFLQQDSNEEVECHIGYEGKDYTINVADNKKIDSNAGSCLSRAQSNFWLQVSPNCFDKEFQIACDKNFIANLIFKNQNSPAIHVLEGTESSPAFGTIKLNVRSKCFGESSCDYESTAWATIALLETGHNVEDYIPYVIAMSDTNKRFLPEAFIYILTNYEDYATQLIADQKLGNFWEAKQSANNKFYDTSLALIALGSGSSSSEQITKTRDWLLFSQGSNGCWNNNIKETAMVLWALEGRGGRTGSGSSITMCTDANYFCIPSDECISGQDVGNNYFCGLSTKTCCTDENLKLCSEYNGEQCATNKVCVGNSRKAVDALSGDCCTGTCGDRPTKTQCEANFYTCMDSCSEFQESVSTFACDGTEVCCRTKTTDDEGGSLWWLWTLIILIILVLGAIMWVKRDQVKLFFFKLKTKFKKDKGRGGTEPRGLPPRPGFPPIRRPRPPVAPMRGRVTDSRDAAMSETFRKLQEMSR